MNARELTTVLVFLFRRLLSFNVFSKCPQDSLPMISPTWLTSEGKLDTEALVKVWQTKKADPLSKGLEQLDEYLARLKQDSGWLVVFSRRDNAPELEERLKTEIQTTNSGRTITVIRA